MHIHCIVIVFSLLMKNFIVVLSQKPPDVCICIQTCTSDIGVDVGLMPQQVFLTVANQRAAPRWLVTWFPTSQACQATWDHLWQVLAWSFRCLYNGVHPTHRHCQAP